MMTMVESLAVDCMSVFAKLPCVYLKGDQGFLKSLKDAIVVVAGVSLSHWCRAVGVIGCRHVAGNDSSV